jgi:hypothetical protein
VLVKSEARPADSAVSVTQRIRMKTAAALEGRSAMREGRASPAGRRTLGIIAAVAILAAAPLLAASMDREGRLRLAGEAARQATDAVHLGADAWAAEAEALVPVAEKASKKRQLAAAVRARVDGATLADLMASEPWWEPYRGFIAALSYDGRTLAFAQDAAIGAMVMQVLAHPVREQRGVVARGLAVGNRAVLAAGAPIPGEPGAPVLFLARPIDGQALDAISARLGAPVLLLGPAGELAAGGSPEPLAHLRAAVQGGGVDLTSQDGVPWAAAAAPLGSGLTLWAAARPVDSARAQAVQGGTIKAALWSLAALMAPALLWLTWRRSAVPAVRPEPHPAPMERPVRTLPSGMLEPALGALGRYLLLERIGEGGMAEIFAAASLGAGGFRRFLVIKRLRPEWTSNREAVAHFIDEANLMSTLIHPNIVPVFDFGEAEGAYYLAEEYVVGRDLGRLCRRMVERGEAPLSPQAVLYVLDEVLAALEYAHGRTDDEGVPLRIVHRDVTPANVMISDAGDIKLIDFGIVKTARARLSQTQLGHINGNLEYMAPEQARGQAVDARTDLFSLGLVAYTAATGDRLYRGEALLDLLNRAAAGPGDEERARIARLPAPLRTLVDCVLATDPDDRFQNAREFRAALAPFRGSGKVELIQALARNFGDEVRREQERLIGACPRTAPLSRSQVGVA